MVRLRATLGGQDSDPLAVFRAPPLNETASDRETRMLRESEAVRISNAIDASLSAERAEMKRTQKTSIKILLLGQSESGKSTTLKNFRLKYARDAWDAERESWRAVCQLNLIRSINVILAEMPIGSPKYPNPAPTPSSKDPTEAPLVFSEKHALLKIRLGPLRSVQADLETRFGAAAHEEGQGEWYAGANRDPDVDEDQVRSPVSPRKSHDFAVRSWKQAFGSTSNSPATHDVTEIIAGCKEDMVALFKDVTVQEMLSRTTTLLEASAAFFLWDMDRIATRDYQPSDEDIIYARLRTCGVQEYRLKLDAHSREVLNRHEELVIYDVGGSRNSRRAWIPFFENVTAIITLIPVSCFDQTLAEDKKVNRLQDSFLLWQGICQSPLLTSSTLIVFLNKYDLLEEKIQSGVQVKMHLTSYGDRANEAPLVARYIRQKLKDILTRTPGRIFYPYITSVVDTHATEATIESLQEGILANNLKTFSML